jgi:ribosomal protein L44E
VNKTIYMDHLNIHTGASPWSCSICHKRFKHRVTKQKHEQQHKVAWNNHGTLMALKTEGEDDQDGEDFWNCSICHKNFSNKVNRQKHEEQHKMSWGNLNLIMGSTQAEGPVAEQDTDSETAQNILLICSCGRQFWDICQFETHADGCKAWAASQAEEDEEAVMELASEETSQAYIIKQGDTSQVFFPLKSESGTKSSTDDEAGEPLPLVILQDEEGGTIMLVEGEEDSRLSGDANTVKLPEHDDESQMEESIQEFAPLDQQFSAGKDSIVGENQEVYISMDDTGCVDSVEESFQCGVCYEVFPSMPQVQQHMFSMHNDNISET